MNRFTQNISLLLIVMAVSSSIAFASENHDHDEAPLAAPKQAHQAEEEHAHGAEEPVHDAEKDEHDAEEIEPDNAEDDHNEEGIVKLSAQQMKLANIEVATMSYQQQNYSYYAPGEIISNAYKVQLVSNRLESQVLKRHAALGDEVKQGDLLVTLFSEQMAEKQAMFINAYRDWQRAKGLDNNTLSEKQTKEIEIAYKKQYATLLSNGMNAKSVKQLTNNKSGSDLLGQYQLHAETNGLIITDNFRQGQWLSAGTNLFEISDEYSLWVEAQLPPMSDINVNLGVTANVVVGKHNFKAVVSQTGHSIDTKSRTRLVRLTINNPDHLLHTGQFADVYFQQQSQQPLLQIPESALVHTADGDWAVYVEEQPGHFKQVEVNVVKSIANSRLIDGIADNLKVVISGAFFLASEQAKSGFDIHNH